jgi:hypothetical protein
MMFHRGFTRKLITTYEPMIRDICNDIINEAVDLGEVDATKEIARKLPMRMLGRVVGTPDEDAEWLVSRGDSMIANSDPDFTDYVIDKVDTDEYRFLPFRSPAGKEIYDYGEKQKRLREDEVKLAEMDRSLKEAQFLSLQSQISPHFLFNTLNTISRTSMFEKAPNTVKLIESLSSIFRYTLNRQNRMVALSEEIDILNEYIHIQKIRYGDRLMFETICDVDLSRINIPIFTLQPLVENAIKYGIEPNEKGGRITLIIEQIDRMIRLKISDTGPGIPEDMIKRILLDNGRICSEQSTGIGISNVRRRLSIAFQGRGTFDIQSIMGEGTTIILTIPGETDV